MGVPGAPSRRAARSRREPRHPWVPKAAARRYDHMVPPSEFEGSHSLSPCSASAANLLNCLHSAPGLSAPATVPPGLLPAGAAARPPVLSSASAARAARPPAAKRLLPTGPSDLQPPRSAGPPPPTVPQPPPSATADAGRSLKRKIVSVTGGDPESGRSAETGVTAATHPVAISRPHARHTTRDAADLLQPPPRGTTWQWQPTHINADGANAGPNGITRVLEEADSAAAEPARKRLRGHCHVHVKRDVQQNKHRVFNGESDEQKATANTVPG